MKRYLFFALPVMILAWLAPVSSTAQETGSDDTDVNFDFDPTKFKMGKKSGKRTSLEGYFGIGPTFVTSNFDDGNAYIPEFKPWKSWSTDFGLMARTRLGGAGSSFNISYGLLWRYLNVETDKAVLDWDPETKIPSYDNTDLDGVTNTELNVHTLSIPLLFEYKNKVAIAAGGFVAFRVASSSEADGELDNGDLETTLHADLGLNDVLYGVTGQIGYKRARIYVNYYLNNLFKEDMPYDFTVMNVGIAFF